MPVDPHKITREGVSELRQAVETFIDRRIKTPADFNYLADAIREHSRLSLSATTLKRTWGYIRDTGKEYLPGRYTLCVLARFIGYRDYEDFLDRATHFQSATYIGQTLDCASLDSGAEVLVRWEPGRLCRLRHIEGTAFEVIESVKGKLQSGDRVECGSMTQNAPLYFSRVNRSGEEMMTYVAGTRSGIRFELL